MTRLSGMGIDVEMPSGWDARIYGRPPGELGPALAAGHLSAASHAVVHAGNFPLPATRGDFGSGAVELMRSGDVLVVLFEYGPESAGTPLFAAQGPPQALTADRFSARALQRVIPGQMGTQVFFSTANRAFCLYVVLATHASPSRLVGLVNPVLASLRIAAS